jgi:hypothetical protein
MFSNWNVAWILVSHSPTPWCLSAPPISSFWFDHNKKVKLSLCLTN